MFFVRIWIIDVGGDLFEKVFFIEVVNDSDGDGFDDIWELMFFFDLVMVIGVGNNDGDSLMNFDE